jgi:hypothetical protein
MKLTVAAPAGTVTEGGTLTIVLFDERATIEPPGEAGCDNVTVHVAPAPEAMLAGEHIRLDTVVAVTVNDAVAVVAFSEAVRVAA